MPALHAAAEPGALPDYPIEARKAEAAHRLSAELADRFGCLVQQFQDAVAWNAPRPRAHTTIDSVQQRFVGLHFDLFDRLEIETKHRGSQRISVGEL
jgi:hypothetical protein